MSSPAEKRRTFRALHESGCFVIPNPWDVGTARFLQSLGFKALATTSAGAAWGLGLADDTVDRDTMLAHIRALTEASDVPMNADFGNGFADDPEGVAENVRLCVATGVAGLSIEDMSIRPGKPLYEIELAVERVAAARSAIDASGGDVILVARSEAYRVGYPESAIEAMKRLERFADAGADCLYAPGVTSREEIAALVKAMAPKPVNVLIGGPIGLSVANLVDLGVRRISVGGALARAAWGGFMRAAREIAELGTFEELGNAVGFGELDGFFVGDVGQGDGP
jgi:2-methylisocitrate lyase-like PEP mutase family enzyme